MGNIMSRMIIPFEEKPVFLDVQKQSSFTDTSSPKSLSQSQCQCQSQSQCQCQSQSQTKTTTLDDLQQKERYTHTVRRVPHSSKIMNINN